MRPLTANQLTLRSFLLSLDESLSKAPEHVVRMPDQATATTLRFNINRLLAAVGVAGEEAAQCPQRAALVPLVGKFTFALKPVPEGQIGMLVVAKLRAVAEQEAQSPRSKLAQSLQALQLTQAPQVKQVETFAQQALGQVALPSTIADRLGALLGDEVGAEQLADPLSPESRQTAYYKR